MDNLTQNQHSESADPQPAAKDRVNENGKILVDGFIRITDPNTKEVFVEIRT